MKPSTTACLTLAFAFICGRTSGQERKMLLKPWIVTGIYLPDSSKANDTSYTRYTFDRNESYISFSPTWNGIQQDWSMHGEILSIGIVTYHIDALTDSSLVISSPGFRTMVMEDENHLNHNPADLHVVGTLNGEPVYDANRFITPRYKKGDLYQIIQEKTAVFDIGKASMFIASFIVGKDGTVSDLKVMQGILPDFDKLVARELNKTSKDWAPAVFDGKPVNTRVIYTIQYLDSPSERGY